jgi:hypothetical protein
VLVEQEAGGAASASCDCEAAAAVGAASLVVGVRPSPLELESTESNGVQHETFDDADSFPSPACVDTIQEPAVQKEVHDLTPTALQQPHGHRSRSTPHNRRPTGFAVEPKAKAKSLSNASGSLVPQLEETGEEDEKNKPAESNDPPTPTTGDAHDGGVAEERRIERQDPDTRIANSTERASVSPDKPVEKQRKKKRHAKKNERSPRKAKTTIPPSSELDASQEEPTPSSPLSIHIPQRGNAGDLDDDF